MISEPAPLAARPARGPARRRRLLRLAIGLLLMLLCGEVGARLATWLRFRAALSRHPELAARLEGSRAAALPLSPALLFEPVEKFPVPLHDVAHPEAPPTWTTYGALTLASFPGATAPSPRSQTALRIVLLGDSVTFGGPHRRVQALLDERLGAGKAEVLDLSLPGAHARSLLYVADTFLPELHPDIVAVYTGRNDLVLENVRSRAIIGLGVGRGMDDSLAVQEPSRGLWSLLVGSWDPWETPVWRDWIRGSVGGTTLSYLWTLSRLAWRLGADTVFSTYAGPALDALSAEDRDYYETELSLFWPSLGNLARYDEARRGLNEGLRELSRRARAGLADIDAALRGGRRTFRDLCHTTPDGAERLAVTLADALAPRVRARLGTQRRRAPVSPDRTWSPTTPPPAHHPQDGRCLQGPCPEGACFVAGDTYPYGYAMAALEEATRMANARYRFARLDHWYGDDGPTSQVRISPFCLDRTEAMRQPHERCVAAGACPPFDYTGLPPGPAILPTWDDASDYCRWRGGRLPTDAEWEAAARGPTGRRFPWGETWTGAEANYCGRECPWAARSDPTDGHLLAAPPGTFAASSPYGLEDMAGNLWEYVADCFIYDIHERLRPGAVDPYSPREPFCRRTLRGGSYVSLPVFLEKRTPEGSPDTPVESRGARCAYDFGTTHRPPR